MVKKRRKPAPHISDVLGRRLHDAREAAGKTQRQVAIECDIWVQEVGAYERGARMPTLPKLIRLCDALGIGLDDLVGGAVG